MLFCFRLKKVINDDSTVVTRIKLLCLQIRLLFLPFSLIIRITKFFNNARNIINETLARHYFLYIHHVYPLKNAFQPMILRCLV